MEQISYNEAVELIYRAVEVPGLWAEALGAVLAMETAATGSLNIFDRSGGATSFVWEHGFSSDAQRLYGEYYHRVDPLGAIWQQPTDTAVFGQDYVPAAEFERSEIWNDYSRVHLDAFHLICASFPLLDGHLGAIGLHRGRQARAFGAAEKNRLDRLLPHLQGALRLRQRLTPANGAGISVAVLNSLEIAIVVARGDGTPVFANRAALASAAIRVGAGYRPIGTADQGEQRRLLAVVRDAGTGGAGGAVLLTAVGQAPVAALVTPLPPGLAEALPGPRGLALVALRALGGARPTIAARLRQLFGLTGAEATLALALLAGQRLDEIAEARNVRITTVRFQLRAILDKTGTRSQSDLVRLLARLTPFAKTKGRSWNDRPKSSCLNELTLRSARQCPGATPSGGT